MNIFLFQKNGNVLLKLILPLFLSRVRFI